MKVTQKEIENVIKLSAFERYQFLIKRICGFDLIYSLKNEEGWQITAVDEYKLFSVWSAREYAELNLTDVWTGCKAEEIPLEVFVQELMPWIIEEGLLINVFSVGGETGFVVDPGEFQRDLDEEMNNYR